MPNQAEHKRPDGLAHSSFEKVGERQEAKVHSGSKRTLSSYHETHKGTGLKPIGWVASPGVGRNPESVQGYLQC